MCKGVSAPWAWLGTRICVCPLPRTGAVCAKGRPATRRAHSPPRLELDALIVARGPCLDHVCISDHVFFAAHAVQLARRLSVVPGPCVSPRCLYSRGRPVAAVLPTHAPQPEATRGKPDYGRYERRTCACYASHLPLCHPAVRLVGDREQTLLTRLGSGLQRPACSCTRGARAVRTRGGCAARLCRGQASQAARRSAQAHRGLFVFQRPGTVVVTACVSTGVSS